MSIPREKIGLEVAVMREIIPFFPRTEAAFDIDIECIEEMVGTEEQLKWLVKAACKSMQNFSLPELRALYCTRYDPADRIPATVSLPGASLENYERAYAERAARETDAKMAAWKKEKELAPGDYEPLMLVAPLVAKPIPKAAPAPLPVGPPTRELEKQLARELAEAPIPDEEERQRKAAELEAAVKARLTRAS